MLNRLSLAAVLAAAAGAALCTAFTTTPKAAAAPDTAAPPPASMPQIECVNGFSKDYCDGVMYPGDTQISGCITPGPVPSCRTARIRGATLVFTTFSNSQTCGSTINSTCDEIRNGRFKVSSNFTIRLQKHCPYRGCWEGEYAEWQSEDGSIYAGTLMGTIGVGSHRAMNSTPCAHNPNQRNCERCYDVSFDSQSSVWRIGYEAAFHGKRIDDPTGQEVCFTLSGDFYIPGTADSPRWDTEWKALGTADGVHITFCP
jgi:hypothetical protein